MNILIFPAVYALQLAVTLPPFQDTCKDKTPRTYTLYATHHLLDIFLFWSFLFLTTRSDHMLHATAVILVALHWITNNNRCVATVVMNRACGYPEEQWLDSLKNRLDFQIWPHKTGLGLQAWSHYVHFVWLAILLAYDAVAISRKN